MIVVLEDTKILKGRIAPILTKIASAMYWPTKEDYGQHYVTKRKGTHGPRTIFGQVSLTLDLRVSPTEKPQNTPAKTTFQPQTIAIEHKTQHPM